MEEDTIYSEAKPPAPKFVRVFDIGKSKESFLRSCCQAVGLIANTSPLPRVSWVTRPTTRRWFWRKPQQDEEFPFTLRFVDVNYNGILLHLIENGEVQVQRTENPLKFRLVRMR
jgi:hypothetical protein